MIIATDENWCNVFLFFMNDIDAMLLKMWHSIHNYYTVRKFDRKNEEGEKIRKNDLVLEIYIHTLQKKCLLAIKNFWRTQKALSKNLIFDGKIKLSQILGKMWNICDQQGKLSQLCVIAVTNTNILEGNFPNFPPYYLRGTIKNLSQKVYYLWWLKKSHHEY